VLPYLFKKVWGLPLIRRVWLSWKKENLKSFNILVPGSISSAIREEFKDCFWSSTDVKIIEYGNKNDLAAILNQYDRSYPLNAVYPDPKCSGEGYILIDSTGSLRSAEGALGEAIRLKAHTWVAREINKRISIRMSRILACVGISPNAISFFGLMLAAAAALFAALGTHAGFIAGGLLLQLNSVLDGSDGEVARLTYRTSEVGRKLDIIIDYLSILMFTGGAVIGVYRYGMTEFALYGAVIIAVSLIAVLFLGFIFRRSPARHLMMEDEEGFIERVVPKGFGMSAKDLFYKILFCLSRRDAYILIICMLGLFFPPLAVLAFLVFLYLDTLLITFMSIRRVESVLATQA